MGGRRRTPKTKGGARNAAEAVSTLTDGPVEGEFEIDTGTARLERDRFSTGWILYVNGVPSSHVDLAAPEQLDFEYMRWIAALMRARFAPDDFGERKLRALHLGGGACSMARWVHATYEARQVVVELDGKLADYVRQWFDLPRAPLLRLRQGEAGQVLGSLTEATRDVVIRDVFAGDATPDALTGEETARDADRVLDAGGLYIVNCGDRPDLANFRREAGVLRSVFGHVVAVADPAMFKGRRRGNVIIACSQEPVVAEVAAAGLRRELLGGGVPAAYWDEEKVRAFAG
ncbi:spermidine synthase [Zhihengliuella salsuginis]|uniref:Spermidine synthase n=1 Tax=Zhihengliuella salsuginis TaxID=578222 RepID=A0ABQ3GAT9_9MICC|nr:spermidine synthase [Zhihengliuella salsuginis]